MPPGKTPPSSYHQPPPVSRKLLISPRKHFFWKSIPTTESGGGGRKRWNYAVPIAPKTKRKFFLIKSSESILSLCAAVTSWKKNQKSPIYWFFIKLEKFHFRHISDNSYPKSKKKKKTNKVNFNSLCYYNFMLKIGKIIFIYFWQNLILDTLRVLLA